MLRTRLAELQPTIRESEIEEVFATNTDLLREALGLDFELRLIVRQLDLASGRLDMLLFGQADLFLVELKVVPFENDFIGQIGGYRTDLSELQRQGRLAQGRIHAVILVTECSPPDVETCAQEAIALKMYSPERVLQDFYRRMVGQSGFLTVKPKDYGVWNLHLINRALALLSQENNIQDLARAIGLAPNTVRNHLRFAEQLLLTRQRNRRYELTELGQSFVKLRDPIFSDWSLSPQQAALLRNQILKDPFASPTIFGIFAIVESVFILSRNSYPVEMEKLIKFYREFVGKRFEWKTDRSALLGCSAFSHFAADLGLLAQAGGNVLLTPSGYRFTLLLQLHKGIQMVDALQRS